MNNADVDRQGFLGPLFETARQETRIVVVGVSGGGSHVVQQLAHLGFAQIYLFDPDTFGKENLHRHVGARHSDIEAKTSKVAIGKRVALDVFPAAQVKPISARWQDYPELLRSCDLIFGCVDTFQGRKELEASARRYLVPYIDIGMDVLTSEGTSPRMVGQVVLSMPGASCLECLGIVTDRELAREASLYGAKAVRQQVVNANGQLASAAVGVALDLLTAWSSPLHPPLILQYDGNRCTIEPSRKLDGRERDPCPHFPPAQVGDPVGISR